MPEKIKLKGYDFLVSHCRCYTGISIKDQQAMFFFFHFQDARVVNFDPVGHEIFYPSKEDLMSKYRIIVTTLVTAGR